MDFFLFLTRLGFFLFFFPLPPFLSSLVLFPSLDLWNPPNRDEDVEKKPIGWGGGERAESVCGMASTPLARSPAGRKIFLLLNFSSFQLDAPSPWSGPKVLCEVCFEIKTTPPPPPHTTLSTHPEPLHL